MTVAYCSREDVKAALDIAPTGRADSQIDRAVLGATQGIEGLLNRVFYPTFGSKGWDWPNWQYAYPWDLYLDRNELLDVTSVVTGGCTLVRGSVDPVTGAHSGDFVLQPFNSPPPYSRVELFLDRHGAYGPPAGAGTYQLSVVITGAWGGCMDTTTAGQLTADIDATTTSVTVSDSSAVGTLDTIIVGGEYMTVTGRSMATTGQTLQTPVGASKADTVLQVADGTQYYAGETLLLDGERVQVTDVAGHALVVKRAWDGTVLAAHTGSTIYAPRRCTVQRGQLGTTPAAHLAGAPVARHAVPDLVRNLCIAEASVNVIRDTMGWAPTRESGGGGRAVSLTDLNDLRDQAYTQHARQSRTRAV